MGRIIPMDVKTLIAVGGLVVSVCGPTFKLIFDAGRKAGQDDAIAREVAMLREDLNHKFEFLSVRVAKLEERQK